MKKQDEGFSWSKRVKATLTLLLVTVFARYDPFGLRHQALQRLKSILGDRYRELRKSAHPSVGWSILSSVWTWVVFVPALLAVAVHLTGIVPRHLVLPREVVSESLSLVSPIPLSLVGLVIPFLALAVSVVYSKMGTGAVAYVMKNNRVVRIVYAALSILGLLLILRFSLAIAASVIGDQATLRLVLNVGWLVAFMSVWWVLLLIVLAGIGVSSVLAVFSPEKALGVLNTEMVRQSMRSLRREFSENLGIKVLEDSFKDDYVEVGYFQPSDGEFVTSEKTGTITNVSIWGLSRINSVLTPQPDGFLKVLLTKPFYHIAPSDSQIAGIRGSISKDIPLPLLKAALRSCYRIRRPKTEADKLYLAVEHYKEITSSILKGDNEDLVRVALDGYGAILRKYMALDLRLSAKDSPGILGDWHPIMVVMGALAKAVTAVVSTSESKNVSMVAHWVKVLMRECIRNHEEYLFSRLLELYRTMFYVARESNNTLGVHRSHFEPMQLLDYDVFRFGKTETIVSDEVAFRCRLARLIVEHLARLLRDSMDANDPKAVGEMLLHLQPEELFGHFHPDLPFDCSEVEWKLRSENLTGNEAATLEDQHKACKFIESFRKDSRQWHVDILHNSLMYLIDKIAHRAIKIESVEEVIGKIWSKLPEWAQTVNWIERYNVGRQIFNERMWEYWPKSRRPQSKSPMAAPILVFSIRGLFLQSQSPTPLSIPGLRTIDGFYDQILAEARSVVANGSWSGLTGIIGEDTLELFELALQNARQEYNDNVAKSVKTASLSEHKIAEFRQKVVTSYHDASVLRHVILQASSPTPEDYDSHPPQTISILQNRYPKEAFIEQSRISYFGLGENEGRALGEGIDEHIWTTVKDKLIPERLSEVGGDDIAALDNALDEYSGQSRSRVIIVLSGQSDIRFNLWSAEKFVSAMELGRQKRRGFYGEYDRVPVYAVFFAEKDEVMLLSLDDVMFQDLQEPSVSVAEFTDDEREDLAERANIEEEKLKEEVLVRVRITCALGTAKNLGSKIIALAKE